MLRRCTNGKENISRNKSCQKLNDQKYWSIQSVFVCVCLRQFASQVLMWHAQALGEQTGTKLSPSGPISIRAALTWHGSVCRPEAVSMAAGGMTGEEMGWEDRAGDRGRKTAHLHSLPQTSDFNALLSPFIMNSLNLLSLLHYFNPENFLRPHWTARKYENKKTYTNLKQLTENTQRMKITVFWFILGNRSNPRPSGMHVRWKM